MNNCVKGPWTVEDDPVIEGQLIIVEAGKPVYLWRVIATVAAGDEPGDITATEQVAHARLIAAAPDLVEALQEVIAVAISLSKKVYGTADGSPVLERAETALKKAGVL